MFKVSSIQYIYSRLHRDHGENLPVSKYITFNYLPLDFNQRLLIPVAFFTTFSSVSVSATSSAFLAVRLPPALLQFVSLALWSLGVFS